MLILFVSVWILALIFFNVSFFFFAKNWRGGKCPKPVGISIPFFSLLTFTHIADHFNKIQGLQGTVFGHMEVANTECWRIVYFLPDPGRSRCTVQNSLYGLYLSLYSVQTVLTIYSYDNS